MEQSAVETGNDASAQNGAEGEKPAAKGGKNLDERLTDAELLDLIPYLDLGDFYPIGLKLQYDKATLNQIRGANKNDIAGGFKTLFASWENYVSASPRKQREMLADALTFVERKDLAGKILGKQENSSKHFEYACKNHSFRPASFYCRKCKAQVCDRCLEDDHKSNTFAPINDVHIELKHKLKTYLDRIGAARGRLEQLHATSVSGTITATQVGIQVSKEGIYKVFSEAHNMLARERDLLLEKATVLEKTADPKVYGFALSTLKRCESVLEDVKDRAQFVSDMDKIDVATKKIDVLQNASLDGGPLRNLAKLKTKMVPCPSVYLGHLEEISGWDFADKFDLPEDKKEEMNTCIKLSGRKIIIGYRLGGADIIDVDTKKSSRIAYDAQISSMALMSNGHLLLCYTDNKLGMITQEGRRISSYFFTQKTNKPCCVCVDNQDTIYMGYSEFSNIEVFETTGGFIKNISTILQPWCMSFMKSGHIAVTECTVGLRDAVEIMGLDGRSVGHIIGRLGCSPFSCCDDEGNIFIAMVTNEGRATIRKYSPTGEHLETVLEELQLEWHDQREWLQLLSLSPNELILCDRGSIYMYRRRPTLSMMTTILGSD